MVEKNEADCKEGDTLEMAKRTRTSFLVFKEVSGEISYNKADTDWACVAPFNASKKRRTR